MSGKLCFGAVKNNAANIRISRAFADGSRYRALGTALARPITDNPHPTGSPEKSAWDAGWNVADGEAGGFMGAIGCIVGGVILV